MKRFHISEWFHKNINTEKYITVYDYKENCTKFQIKLKLKNISLSLNVVLKSIMEQCYFMKMSDIQKIKQPLPLYT